tara:strand:+ start:1144 stop:1575 length:432 start_codon:yes stop_codon:yes gene_type:complete
MYRVEIEIDGQPQGKARPRMSRSGHVYTPQKTRSYESLIKAACFREMQSHNLEPTESPVKVSVVAFMEIPKSWSKKKAKSAEYALIHPTAKPDLDNIIKAALDGISGPQGIIRDDKQVVSIKAVKTFCHPDRGPVLHVSVSWE